MEWWLRELESASIGCSPIKNLQEVFEDPQVKAPLGWRQPYISLSERSSRPTVALSRLLPGSKAGDGD